LIQGRGVDIVDVVQIRGGIGDRVFLQSFLRGGKRSSDGSYIGGSKKVVGVGAGERIRAGIAGLVLVRIGIS